MYDSLIRGGTVIDGTGRERRRADIAIKDGMIAAIGEMPSSSAETVIDADGLIVTPGFIDVHTHYDAQLMWDPTASPSPYHGVTTILGGFCGFGLAPLTPDATEYLVLMLSQVEDIPLASLRAGVPCDWRTFGEFLTRLEGNIAVNAGFSVGHSTVRRIVMGERALGEKATQGDIAAMQQFLASAFRDGALGFSSSHSTSHNDHRGEPVPSRFAALEEFVALASVCRDFEGTGVEIQPGLAYDEQACELVTQMSLAAERTLNWNLIAANDLTPGTLDRIERQLAMSDYAAAQGARVIGLTLPTGVGLHFDLVRGGIFDLIPGWAELFKLPLPQRIERLRDAAYRARLLEGARSPESPIPALADFDVMFIEQGMSSSTERFSGKTISEVGRATGKPPFDAMLDVALEDGLRTLFSMRDEGEGKAAYAYRTKLWRDPRCVVGGSDAGAHVETIDSFGLHTQMVGQAVRTHGVIGMEEAIHLITQAPAALMGLRDRGVLRRGFRADITIVDETRIGRGPVYMRNDFPTGASRLYAEAEGIERVVVSGETIIENNAYTGRKPGKVLRSGTDTYTVGTEQMAMAG